MNQISVEWLLPYTRTNSQDIKKSNLASIRLRAAVCIEALKKNHNKADFGDAQHTSTASTLIIGKVDFISDPTRPERWLNHIYSARKRGARIVVDYTDHHLETETAADQFYRAALENADLTICSSTHLSKKISPFYKGKIKVIEDPIEVPILPPVTRDQRKKTALWVGHSSNLRYLIDFLCNDFSLTEPMRLIAMTNAYPLAEKNARMLSKPHLENLEICVVPWSLPDMITVASLSNVCWIPAGINSKRKSGASSIRLLTALALGLPVAADELESYLPFRKYFASLHTPEFPNMMNKPEQFFDQVIEAQVHIGQHYTQEAIGRQWLSILN
jgi:hypothetical protein